MTKTKLNIAKVLEVITLICGIKETENFIKAMIEEPQHYRDWIVENFPEWRTLHITERPILTPNDEVRFVKQVLSDLTEKYGPWHTDIFLSQVRDNDSLYSNWFKEHREEIDYQSWLSPELDEDDY